MQILVNNDSCSRKIPSQNEQSQPDAGSEQKFSNLYKKKEKQKKKESDPSLVAAFFQQQKSALLGNMSSNVEEQSGSINSLKNTGSVAQDNHMHVERIDMRTLSVRLASGPMAGLEIQASLYAGRVQMKIRAKDETHYKCIQRCMSDLEAKANQISSYQVEINLEKKRGQ
ncbi:hypothetical protein [Vibrio marisflavi]|uniref:Flagellar hook-length control protein-like C-terminal domain-containing protein n=1 Tax=Vibrio marisflavi CECT 7928 TaxID=634439 RepID=A0ABN8DZ75_9VIBR|nr:hypothetical protein [Vibrio marisflavi]CAH0535994.1 hypothetical protein VMF7928_00089 [Vibrio marisflavi CECT 7928]